jgi:hypothetical protein
MAHTTIRPGLLVSLKTSIRGGVRYEKIDLDPEHKEGEASVARWETKREIANAEEHRAAVVARGKARTAITRACVASTFGLLCPTQNEQALTDAMSDAQRIVGEFNATAKFGRIEVLCLTGRIADSDVEAARAIGAEMRDLLSAMEAGIRSANPEEIRAAASRARAVSGMLSDSAKGAVAKAVEEARRIAKEIVQRVEKAGETAASVVDGLQLAALQSARFAVLDIDGVGEAPASDLFAVSPAPAIDFEPAPAANESPAEIARRQRAAYGIDADFTTPTGE